MAKKNINVEEKSTAKKNKNLKSKQNSNKQIEEALQVVETVIETSVINPLITIKDMDDEDVKSETVTVTTLVKDESPIKIIEETDEPVIAPKTISVKEDKTVKPIEKETKKPTQAIKKRKPKMNFNYFWNGTYIG